MEAQALYDFNARSTREVSFHKGDTVSLTKQVSNDWWKGSVRGQEGLIPDKYIMLRMKYVIYYLLNRYLFEINYVAVTKTQSYYLQLLSKL